MFDLKRLLKVSKRAFIILFCLVLSLGIGKAQNTAPVRFTFSNFQITPAAYSLVSMTPLYKVGVNGSVIVGSPTVTLQAGTNGSVLFTNVLVGGSYLVQFRNQNPSQPITSFTNSFPINLAGTNEVDASQWVFWTFIAQGGTTSTGGSSTNTFIGATGIATITTNTIGARYTVNVLSESNSIMNLVTNYAYPTSNPSLFVDRTITNNYATQPFVTNAVLGLESVSTNGYVRSTITNGLYSGNAVTQAVAGLMFNGTNGFIDGATASTIAVGVIPPVVSGILIASNYATRAFVTNASLGLIFDGTNGLATKPFATNATLGLLSVGTNGFIRLSDATNVTLALELVSTNGYLRSNVVLNLIGDATNGFVRSTITNGLASMAAVTNVSGSYSNGIVLTISNSIIITSNGLLSRIDATNNFIQISNGGGTNTTLVTSPAIGVTNLTLLGTENANQKAVSNASVFTVQSAANIVYVAMSPSSDFASVLTYSNAALGTAWGFIPDNTAFGNGYGKAATIGSMVLAQPRTLQSWRFEGTTGGFYSQFVNTSNLVGNVLNQITNIASTVPGSGGFISSTNTVGSTNGAGQGTFFNSNGGTVWTNIDNTIFTIVLSGGNFNYISNGFTWWTSPSLFTNAWTVGVSGGGNSPVTFIGNHYQGNSTIIDGYLNSTNLTAQINSAIQTGTNSEEQVFFYNGNPSNHVIGFGASICFNTNGNLYINRTGNSNNWLQILGN